jgi:hypothetical protein
MEEGYGGSDRGHSDVPFIRRGVRPDSVKVVKFTGKNFILWKQSLEVYLKIADLFDFVTGTSVKPLEGTIARRQWEQMNNQAMAVLIGALTEEQHWLVTQCKSAAEMWTTLERTYMRRSAANKGQLIEEYESYSMGRGVSLDTYIRELKNKQEKLRGVGIVSDEEMKVLKLLRGLSEEYDMDRKIIENTPDISFEEACSKLLNEADIRRKRVGTKAPMANAADGRPRPVRRCFNCNSESHLSTSCPEVRKVGTSFGKLTCFVCGSEKHRASGCPKRFNAKAAGRANMSDGGDKEGGAVQGGEASS